MSGPVFYIATLALATGRTVAINLASVDYFEDEDGSTQDPADSCVTVNFKGGRVLLVTGTVQSIMDQVSEGDGVSIVVPGFGAREEWGEADE